jgi:hypothetical protein
MAAVRKWWDDLSGNVLTAGTSTAYTATSNQVITGLGAAQDGFTITVRMHATNGTDPTFALDGQTAKQIRKVYGTNIPSGVLLINGVYKFTYDSTDDAWIVNGYFGSTFNTDNPDLAAIEALAGTSGALKKTAANTWALDDLTTDIIFVASTGNTSVALDTGVLGDVQVDFACTITGVTLLADQSGSCVVDIWKDTYANYPPTNDDSITASATPTISTATKANDTTLTGWTTSITAGDTLRFNLDSVTSISRLTIKLKVKRYA